MRMNKLIVDQNQFANCIVKCDQRLLKSVKVNHVWWRVRVRDKNRDKDRDRDREYTNRIHIDGVFVHLLQLY